MTTQSHTQRTEQAIRLTSVAAVCAWDAAYSPKRNEQLVEGFGT